MALLGAATGAYAYLMGPALRFLLTGGRDGLSLAAKLVPHLAEVDRDGALWLLPLVVVAIGVVKGLGYLGQFYWMGLYGQRVVMDLRRRLFARLGALSPSQLGRERSGDLLSRFSADAAAIESAATLTVASFVRDGLQILILLAVALSLHWQLALGAIAVVPLAAWPASRLTRALLGKMREGQAKLGELAAQVQEGVGGLRTIQAYGGRQAELSRFDAHARAHLGAMLRAGWTRGAVPGLMELLAAAAIALSLSFAAGTRAVPPEDLISLLTAVVLIYQPAKDLGRVSQYALQAAVAGERVFRVLSLEHPVRDAPGARNAPPLQRGISVEAVSFSYSGRPVLDSLSLELPAGKVTALVGPSGGGKSTLVSLLLRFELPSGGRILFDGEDGCRLTSASIRAQFALVTQEPLLFAGSVLENLRLSRPGASMEEAVAAARVANAEEFIRALPRGYDTEVGERGVVLSGGQKQRLCLARAVLSAAPVLVLDEATSNLDPEGEREVQRALAEVLRGRTALIIAHRLSTIASADRIYVAQGGRVIEQGTHGELLGRGGLYARLWSLQSGPDDARASVA
ncbi:MAG: ABC transporter ATP-binding protein [Myxococcales bacterium]|nr:ABC transporter ATP-binding protein [Myxococcales bacterium]